MSASTLRRTAAALCALAATSAHGQLRQAAPTSTITRSTTTARATTTTARTTTTAGRTATDLLGGKSITLDDRINVAEPAPAPPPPPPGYRFAMPPGQPYAVEFVVDWATLGLNPGRGYTIDFGDGQRAPVWDTVRHDYRRAVDHRRPSTVFDTRLLDPRGNVIEARPLTIGSPIALSRQMGFAQAEMDPPAAQALTCPTRLRASVTNHEDQTVTYHRFLRRFRPCDPSRAAFVQDTDLQSAIGTSALRARQARPGVHGDPRSETAGMLRLAPGASAGMDFNVPCEKTADMCVVSWTLVGRTDDGTPAYADFHAEVGRNPFRLEEVPRATGSFLNELVAAGLVADPTVIDADTLRQLALANQIVKTPTGWEVVK